MWANAAVRSYAVEFAVDKAKPRVEITIRALDAGEGGEG